MGIPEKIGRYEIIEELGRGGMAVVYLARDPLMARRVAVKLMPAQFTFNESLRARFQREARIVASLEHPAIVPVHDFGEFGEQPYLVMRYMVGGSLSQYSKGRALPLPEVVRILTPLSLALDKAHEKHIIHRDLKPDNILFDGDKNPYLSDFGIARLAEGTQTTTIMGTPAYMSPEQITGDVELDARSDIYALGVILFEMLSGQQPFTGDTPTNIMMKHVMEPVPVILDLATNLPPATQGIIDKAMAKKREDRYDTAEEMVSAVNGLLSHTQAAEVGAAIAGTRVQETILEIPDATPAYMATVIEPPTNNQPDAIWPKEEDAEDVVRAPVSGQAEHTAASKRPVWLLAGGIVVVLILLCVVGWGAVKLINGDQGKGKSTSITSSTSGLSASAGIATKASSSLAAESSALVSPTTPVEEALPEATSTPEPLPTSAPTDVPQTEEAVVELPTVELLFADDFESKASAADWDLWQNESAEFSIAEGRLTAVGKDQELLNWTHQLELYPDFEARVTASILEGGKAAFFGMVFAAENEDYIGCFVQGDESAYCAQSSAGQADFTDWVKANLSPLRNDEIQFVVNQGLWAMAVNGKCIGSGSNDFITEGHVSLAVSTENNDKPARIVYDDFLIQTPSDEGLALLGCVPEYFQ